MNSDFLNTFKIVFFENYGRVLTGLGNTLLVAVCAFILGIAIGIIVSTIKLLPSKNIFVKILQWIGNVYVSFFRGTPIMVQLLLFYWGVFLPLNINELFIGIIIFGLNSGAYMSEIMRAGILSVDKGQLEAGRSLGLSHSVTMFKIILPQAFKNMIPTMTNEFIALIKETSLVGFILVVDITLVFKQIANQTYDYLSTYLILAFIYYIIVMIGTLILKAIERRLRKSDNR